MLSLTCQNKLANRGSPGRVGPNLVAHLLVPSHVDRFQVNNIPLPPSVISVMLTNYFPAARTSQVQMVLTIHENTRISVICHAVSVRNLDTSHAGLEILLEHTCQRR